MKQVPVGQMNARGVLGFREAVEVTVWGKVVGTFVPLGIDTRFAGVLGNDGYGPLPDIRPQGAKVGAAVTHAASAELEGASPAVVNTPRLPKTHEPSREAGRTAAAPGERTGRGEGPTVDATTARQIIKSKKVRVVRPDPPTDISTTASVERFDIPARGKPIDVTPARTVQENRDMYRRQQEALSKAFPQKARK